MAHCEFIRSGHTYLLYRLLPNGELPGQQSQHSTAYGDSETGVCVDAGRIADVVRVVGQNGFHDGLLVSHLQNMAAGKVADEVLLKKQLITAMLLQIFLEMLIMGICKGVGGIVDQLSKLIIVQKPEPLLPFKTGRNPPDIGLGIAPVVAPKPLAPERAFQVGGGVLVRLNAADEKRPDIPAGRIVQIPLHQIMSKLLMAFCFHWSSHLPGSCALFRLYYIIKNIKMGLENIFSQTATKRAALNMNNL